MFVPNFKNPRYSRSWEIFRKKGLHTEKDKNYTPPLYFICWGINSVAQDQTAPPRSNGRVSTICFIKKKYCKALSFWTDRTEQTADLDQMRQN